MSCWFLVLDCEVGFIFFGWKWSDQLQEMGGKFGAHPKSLWEAAALDTSHSFQCQAGKTTSPLLQILCHQNWGEQPVSPACLLLLQSQPGRPREASPGSCPSWYFLFSLLLWLWPSEALHLWQVSMKENPSTLLLSHKHLILIHSGGLLHGYKHTGCWFICS